MELKQIHQGRVLEIGATAASVRRRGSLAGGGWPGPGGSSPSVVTLHGTLLKLVQHRRVHGKGIKDVLKVFKQSLIVSA